MRQLLTFPIMIAILGSLALLADLNFSEDSTAQERGISEAQADEFEQRLIQIDRLIDRAEANDEKDRIFELRRERERLRDQLEAYERDGIERYEIERDHEEDADEEWSELDERLERQVIHLKMHRAEMELEQMRLGLEVARQESTLRLAKMATDPYAIKVHAISELVRNEEAEVAADILSDLLNETDNEMLRSIIQVHLTELHRRSEQPERARQVLRQLILGKE